MLFPSLSPLPPSSRRPRRADGARHPEAQDGRHDRASGAPDGHGPDALRAHLPPALPTAQAAAARAEGDPGGDRGTGAGAGLQGQGAPAGGVRRQTSG